MVTFGFGQVVVYVLINWIEVTHGPNGLPVPEVTIFGAPLSPIGLYILVAIVFALAVWFQWNIRRTRIGRAFMAVRGSAIAAQSMGIPVAQYKTIAFGISAFYGGLSGALYAPISGYINPDAFTFGVSISYVTMTVVGGAATLAGPIIGAALLTVLPEFLRTFAQYKEVLSGIILLIFIVLLPTGLVGLARRFHGMLRHSLGR
jgi:branched-chain amino acid transport system permease protein